MNNIVVKKGYNPPYINEFSESLLGGFYAKDNEIADDVLARAAEAYCFGDYELAQRIYDAVWNGWFMFASPIISNAPKGKWKKNISSLDWRSGESLMQYWDGDIDRGLPISCFAAYLGDSVNEQRDFMAEIAMLSVAGGGVGVHSGIRAISNKAPGPIPYQKVLDALIGYWQQSTTRRGTTAVYLDVDHPDIVEHINFRVPTGGDRKRKSDNLQQFHSAVNITDKFVAAVLADEDFDLVCPHSGEIRETLKARSLWQMILDTRALTGEPYIFKIDTANRALPESQKELGLEIKGSNICLSGDTRLLTSNGLVKIQDLEGQNFRVYNGDGEYHAATAFVTADEADVYELTLENGQRIRATEDHIFEVRKVFGDRNRYHEYVEMKAKDMLGELVTPFLGSGYWSGSVDIPLDKLKFFGLIQGDGCFVRDTSNPDVKAVHFGNSEPEVVQFIYDICAKYNYHSSDLTLDGGKFYIRDAGLIQELADFGFKFTILTERTLPNSAWNLSSTQVQSFMSGLFSANGTAMPKYNRVAFLTTCDKLSEEVQDLLIALGLPAYRTHGEAQEIEWPNGTYTSKPNWVVSIGSAWGYRKFQEEIGFLHDHKMLPPTENNRSKVSVRSSRVKSIKYVGKEKVYDFNEPITHWGWANGLKTHNCSEISLATDEERTFVCCLSSLNLEKYDEWKDTTLVADLTQFLDNVIQWFIENTNDDPFMKRSNFSALRERALGIGTMGWARYLQSKNIPFESGGFNSAIQHTHKIFSNIKEQAEHASLKLGSERGEAPDMIGTGRRNSHLMAIAPNANSGIILGTSPSIEPEAGIIYMQNTRAGTYRVVNPYFSKIVEEHFSGMENGRELADDVYNSVIHNDGSVQHLEFLTDEQKKVFKTAYEIDQHWVVEQADARQQYVCQSQSVNLFFSAGSSKDYFNSVHLKAITAPYLKGLYYSKVRRGTDVIAIKDKKEEIKTLTDWSVDDLDECLSCQG